MSQSPRSVSPWRRRTSHANHAPRQDACNRPPASASRPAPSARSPSAGRAEARHAAPPRLERHPGGRVIHQVGEEGVIPVTEDVRRGVRGPHHRSIAREGGGHHRPGCDAREGDRDGTRPTSTERPARSRPRRIARSAAPTLTIRDRERSNGPCSRPSSALEDQRMGAHQKPRDGEIATENLQVDHGRETTTVPWAGKPDDRWQRARLPKLDPERQRSGIGGQRHRRQLPVQLHVPVGKLQVAALREPAVELPDPVAVRWRAPDASAYHGGGRQGASVVTMARD